MNSLRSLRALPRVARQSAPLSTSSARWAGKESKLHSEGRASEVEEQKQEQLRAQKEGKAQWKDSLASDSESIIKADRDEAGNTQQHIKELQEESKKVGKQ